MKLITTSLLITTLIISSKQNEKREIIKEQIEYVSEIENNNLKNFTYEDVARYTMATIMGHPAQIIKASKKDNLYYVWYIRKSDKKKYEYKIKFNGNKILWSNIDGRWRNSQYDEKITFLENGNTISIIQTFSDDSRDIQKYHKGQ